MENKYDTVRELQLIQIEIIKLFVSICEKERLTYYMSAGTMLGAVRHKGYIPWDDDADFMMPREDYEKFLQVAPKYMHGYYSIEHFYQNNQFSNCTARITTSEKKLYITSGIKPHTENVWIDILPLDGMPNKKICRLIHKGRLLFARAMFRFSSFDELTQVNKNRPWYEKILIEFAKRFPIQKILSYPKRWKAMDKALKKYSPKTSVLWVCFFGGYKFKEMFPKTVFGKGTLYDFEGMKLRGVDDYDTYLKGIYGDYMQLPPEKKRVPSHVQSIISVTDDVAKGKL